MLQYRLSILVELSGIINGCCGIFDDVLTHFIHIPGIQAQNHIYAISRAAFRRQGSSVSTLRGISAADLAVSTAVLASFSVVSSESPSR